MSGKNIDLSRLSEEALLKKKIAELPLQIEGTWLEECVDQLYGELEEKGVAFRPECYLADEWLAPDKEPVVGIPFFLADPALMSLEKKMMYEVEGGTKQWCMKLLRHEAGHAINYAYRLYRRKRWQEIFGSFSVEYDDVYRFMPYSKGFVRHLDKHYAQCHPDEDFAETFAVWLTPGSDWKTEYRGWKAMEKLRYVERVMEEIGGKEPLVAKGEKHWRLSRLRITLKNYYKKKRDFWAEEFPDFHDSYLLKIFTERSEDIKKPYSAVKFIRKHRRNILNNVAACTRERKFIINDLLNTLIRRCRERNLCVCDDEMLIIGQLTAYVTVLIMNYIYTGRFRGE